MNCSDRRWRRARREERRRGSSWTAGAWSSATSATATATASSFVRLHGACSRTTKSGKSFANARKSVSGVWGWKGTGQRGAAANAIPFSAAKLRQQLMSPVRIVRTTIQNKESRQGCITGFVSASLTKGRSADEGEKIELLKEDRIREVPQEAQVCKQADSLLSIPVVPFVFSNTKILFWYFSLFILLQTFAKHKLIGAESPL